MFIFTLLILLDIKVGIFVFLYSYGWDGSRKIAAIRQDAVFLITQLPILFIALLPSILITNSHFALIASVPLCVISHSSSISRFCCAEHEQRFPFPVCDIGAEQNLIFRIHLI